MKRALDAGVLGAVYLCLATAAHAGTSSAQNPTVVFSLPGVKQVTLNACNGTACNSKTQPVTVLDPMPAITTAAAGQATVEVGQLVHLLGAGTGKPPLTLTWNVTPLLVTLPGGDVYWDTQGRTPGPYAVALTLSNSAGSINSLPAIVTLVPAQGGDFYTIAPCRVYDSRFGVAPLASGSTKTVGIAGGTCGIPAAARAVALNVTVINPTGTGFATLYPGNYPQPTTSTINFAPGINRANFGIVPIATDASGLLSVSLFLGATGSADVALDATGYFLASP